MHALLPAPGDGRSAAASSPRVNTLASRQEHLLALTRLLQAKLGKFGTSLELHAHKGEVQRLHEAAQRQTREDSLRSYALTIPDPAASRNTGLAPKLANMANMDAPPCNGHELKSPTSIPPPRPILRPAATAPPVESVRLPIYVDPPCRGLLCVMPPRPLSQPMGAQDQYTLPLATLAKMAKTAKMAKMAKHPHATTAGAACGGGKSNATSSIDGAAPVPKTWSAPAVASNLPDVGTTRRIVRTPAASSPRAPLPRVPSAMPRRPASNGATPAAKPAAMPAATPSASDVLAGAWVARERFLWANVSSLYMKRPSPRLLPPPPFHASWRDMEVRRIALLTLLGLTTRTVPEAGHATYRLHALVAPRERTHTAFNASAMGGAATAVVATAAAASVRSKASTHENVTCGGLPCLPPPRVPAHFLTTRTWRPPPLLSWRGAATFRAVMDIRRNASSALVPAGASPFACSRAAVTILRQPRVLRHPTGNHTHITDRVYPASRHSRSHLPWHPHHLPPRRPVPRLLAPPGEGGPRDHSGLIAWLGAHNLSGLVGAYAASHAACAYPRRIAYHAPTLPPPPRRPALPPPLRATTGRAERFDMDGALARAMAFAAKTAAGRKAAESELSISKDEIANLRAQLARLRNTLLRKESHIHQVETVLTQTAEDEAKAKGALKQEAKQRAALEAALTDAQAAYGAYRRVEVTARERLGAAENRRRAAEAEAEALRRKMDVRVATAEATAQAAAEEHVAKAKLEAEARRLQARRLARLHEASSRREARLLREAKKLRDHIATISEEVATLRRSGPPPTEVATLASLTVRDRLHVTDRLIVTTAKANRTTAPLARSE